MTTFLEGDFYKTNKKMKKIKIMPEYGCSPLWLYENNILVKNFPINELNISKTLKETIIKWEDTYEKTYNDDYPPDSGFQNSKDEKEFILSGVYIWKNIINELDNSYNVVFYCISTNKLYDTFQDYDEEISS